MIKVVESRACTHDNSVALSGINTEISLSEYLVFLEENKQDTKKTKYSY